MKKIKQIVSWLRELKNKPAKDNYFDVAFGAILACIGLLLYLNTEDMDKFIVIAFPFLISFLNEVVNAIESKKFGWIDVALRTLIGIIMYLIII